MSKIYRTTVQEDAEGNASIEFPPELLKQLDWNEGDELVWDDRPLRATSSYEGDELEWDETELWEDDGEFKGAVIYKKK